MLILPAIDLRDGKCVRLYQGDYGQETVYSEKPADVAAAFERAGAEWIHVVDLDGAKSGEPQNWEVLKSIRHATSAHIEFGGGVRDLRTAHAVSDLGIDRIVLGSSLFADPKIAFEIFEFLDDRGVASLDSRLGKLATEGWTQESPFGVMESVQSAERFGARRLIVTDISRDGTLKGPNLELLRSVLDAATVPVIASGGVSSLDDIAELASLDNSALEGVIVGKALYEQRFTFAEAVNRMRVQ